MESLAQFINSTAQKRERVFYPIAVRRIRSAGRRSLTLAAAHIHRQSIFILIVPLEGEHRGSLRVAHSERPLFAAAPAKINNDHHNSLVQHQWLAGQMKKQREEIISWLAHALVAIAQEDAAR